MMIRSGRYELLWRALKTCEKPSRSPHNAFSLPAECRLDPCEKEPRGLVAIGEDQTIALMVSGKMFRGTQ